MSEYQSHLQQTLSLLRSGNAKKALQTFRPMLCYPGLVEHPAEFAEALQVLAEISVQIGETAFATQLRNAAHTPTDVKQLYYIGYEMIEHGLSDMAATVLAYAHRLQPDNPVLALAHIGAHAGANVLALLREEGQRQKQWAGSPVPGSFFYSISYRYDR
jgi:hypothetical protein